MQTHTHMYASMYMHMHAPMHHAHAYARIHLYIYILIWKPLKSKQAIYMKKKKQIQIYTCNFTSSERSELGKFLVII